VALDSVMGTASVQVPSSSTREVRGRIVHRQAKEWPVLRRDTLNVSSQIFEVLLFDIVHSE
jgi:hypothetical protein